MQAIFETVFDVLYLATVIALGSIMTARSRGNRGQLLSGIMALTLGAGDAFHLVPRALALCTTGLASWQGPLGIGKLITSITMTVFYVLLYYVWRERYGIQGKKGLTISVYCLAAARILLCFCPLNAWTTDEGSLLWGILRNIPFAALGIIIIVLFFRSTARTEDKAYRFMWLTIVLSFAFYLPVVLFSSQYPAVGILMIPKTCAYIWTVLIGFCAMRQDSNGKRAPLSISADTKA